MKESILLAGTSAVFVVASLGAVVLLVLKGTVLTLDGLMILAVGLLVAGVFSWFALSALKESRPPASKETKPPAGEKTA